SGAVEGHGGAHVPAQVAPARPHCPAAPPPDSHQSDAVSFWGKGEPGMGPAPHRVQFGSVRSVDRRRGEFPSRRTCLGKGGAGPVSLFGFWRRDWREPAIRRPGRPGSLLGLFGVWSCGLEVPGPRPVYRLVGPTAATPSGPHRQQYPLSYSTMGQGASFGQLDIGPSQPPARPRLAGQVWAWHRAAGDLCGTGAFSGHGLSCGQLAGGGRDDRAHPAGSAHLYSSARQRHLSLSVAARLPGGAASMKSREELQGEFAGNPAGLLEYTWQLHQQLSQQEQLLAATHQELARQEQLLAEARAYIAELKRQLFGPKADKLSPEQEEQLRQLAGDLREEAQRPAPLSQEVLELELPPKDKEKLQREARRRVRHPLPVQLEVQQVVLEPEDKVCGHCQREGRRIGQEITTEYEYVPAKLICKEMVRPKYAHDCSCGTKSITIAPLPPRLVPQSKLGLGLAVYILLSRFDDHIA